MLQRDMLKYTLRFLPLNAGMNKYRPPQRAFVRTSAVSPNPIPAWADIQGVCIEVSRLLEGKLVELNESSKKICSQSFLSRCDVNRGSRFCLGSEQEYYKTCAFLFSIGNASILL